MNINELEKELNAAIESYHTHVVDNINSFHAMNEEEREHFLPQTLDEMNRHAFYTFGSFRDTLVQYLKERE